MGKNRRTHYLIYTEQRRGRGGEDIKDVTKPCSILGTLRQMGWWGAVGVTLLFYGRKNSNLSQAIKALFF